MKIDVAKLDIALAHKEASQECPFCTRRAWTTDETPAAVTPADPDAGEPLAGASIPAAILVCKHCGFIRLHAIEVLLGEAG
jgi:hypothetical protein